MDVFRRSRHDVEIVEEPFGCGGQGFLSRVLRKLPIDVAEGLHVPVELPKVRAPRERTAGYYRKQSREPAGVFLQQVDAEQLGLATGRARKRCLLSHVILGTTLEPPSCG